SPLCGHRDTPRVLQRLSLLALRGTIVLAEAGRSRPGFAAFIQDFDAALGLFELSVAEAREMDAALVQLQRRFEGQITFFEFLDDGLEFGDGGFEIFDGTVHSSGL